ncbi:ribonucleotide-diphosphate reductase subunit beta [Paenibacillus sp. OV219]|uniref:ribonucleotide-diphosphate reductase subunit beta n=1 Tax=Paenibacillus sp. OV219 TaxID=1884377 RepID=UPI0008D14821|nr:ribonucleotide-diphosphate reductase subunit beta [Paenibacillus sp. OV219]SEN20667.1 ribonucleoside-diphosphate reductase beta chain [Paenibacillus sp. OV219]
MKTDSLQKRKLYDVTAPNKSTGMINGRSSNVLNWDDVRYPWAYPLYKNMLGNFWTPFEINMGADIKTWQELTKTEQDSFAKIIGLLAFLDSVQTDYSSKIAGYITDSSVNALMIILAQQEVVHNHSYSYVLSSLVSKSEQEEIFEYWKTDAVLRERNDFIAKGYESFTEEMTPETMLRSLIFDVILEGLFFFASFAFFYDLARQGKMTASSQMINYINRDEQLHVLLFTNIFKEILVENPTLVTAELQEFVYDTFEEAVRLEIKWSHYIIGNKFDGIDGHDLEEYVKFTANKRLAQLGFTEKLYPNAQNNMKWIRYFEDIDSSKQDFFEGKSRQYTKTDEDNGFDDL